MQDVSKFVTSAYRVTGPADNLVSFYIFILKLVLTFKVERLKIVDFANNVDPDDTSVGKLSEEAIVHFNFDSLLNGVNC